MKFIADLHVHSRYSRATSPDMSPEGLCKWAQIKGIGVIGTGDFTHPLWIEELMEKLEPAGAGLYRLKEIHIPSNVPVSCRKDVRFMLTAEVSSIYSKAGRTRKVHTILLAPGFKEAMAINERLSRIGNIRSDGRPILGLDAADLLEIALDVSPDMMVIPAHAWTPHFSVFGAASGFDSLVECYGGLSRHIHAIETGLSSDPAMNRRISMLDDITLISNSDAHSPQNLGREANMFDTELSYHAIIDSIKTKNGFMGTVEFYPEEGKYHIDGHRACGVSLMPKETNELNGICPKCGHKLTIGVLNRVEQLADRDKPAKTSCRYLIPMIEIISELKGKGKNTKSVMAEYMRAIDGLGSELNILMDAPVDDISKSGFPELAGAISRMRKGDVSVTPGYDGVYGVVRVG